LKQQFLEGIADTIRLSVYENNWPIVPSAATITLYKPGTTTALQAEVAVTAIDSTTGEMTYSLTATHTAENDLNYKAVWKYTSNGTDYYQTQLFDVVLSVLSIPITDDDLYNELETLRQANYQVTDTATAGAAGTLTDTKRKEDDSFWKGGKIRIVAGTGVGQERDVTAFVQSTGVFSIAPNWASNPDTTSVYVVVKSFYSKIQAAFDSLCTMIYNKGKRNELILESSQIANPLTYLTISMIALELMTEPDDKWNRIADIYQKKFDTAFNSMKLDYDSDESGAIDEEEGQQGATEIRIGRA
jgi:hypothetical protein